MAVSRRKNKSNLPALLNEYFNLILAVVLVVFLLGAYFIVLSPKINNTKLTIQNNIDSQVRLYNSQQRKLANLKMINTLYQKINPADLQKFNGVLPDAYVSERLFGELEEIIGSGGWVISTISLKIPEEPSSSAPAAPAPADETIAGVDSGNSSPAPAAAVQSQTPDQSIGRISVSVSIESINYAGFKSLLKILESNLRLFDVTNVDFSPDVEQATLQFDTYYYKKAL